MGVAGLEVGQSVAVYGPWGCGTCERCRLGIETYCENVAAAPVPWGGGGLGLDGGKRTMASPKHSPPNSRRSLLRVRPSSGVTSPGYATSPIGSSST
jgi:hypothetical protein